MILSRLVSLKYITYAILLLVMSVCGLEVGLRVYDSYTAQIRTSAVGKEELVAESWKTHHRLKPLRQVVEQNPDLGTPVALRTNSYGVRGPEIDVPKPPGVYRIICLGDESTLAPQTDELETFCARLQQLLQRQSRLPIEVVNAGVPDYCPLLSYLQFRHSLIALQPDLVLLNFDMSDVADDHQYRRHTQTIDSLPLACPHPDLESRMQLPGHRLQDHFLIPKWCCKQLGMIRLKADRSEDRHDIDAPQGRYAWLHDNPPDWSIHVRQALMPIEPLKRAADGIYAKFVLATYPAPWQISSQASNGPDVRARVAIPHDAHFTSRLPFQTLGRYAQKHQLRFCDASPAFTATEKPERLFLRNAARLSREGHELYARVLHRFLEQNVRGVWEPESPVRRQRPMPPAARSARR
jgi:hypothetical protein